MGRTAAGGLTLGSGPSRPAAEVQEYWRRGGGGGLSAVLGPDTGSGRPGGAEAETGGGG